MRMRRRRGGTWRGRPSTAAPARPSPWHGCPWQPSMVDADEATVAGTSGPRQAIVLLAT
jgi:hypothetical protein